MTYILHFLDIKYFSCIAWISIFCKLDIRENAQMNVGSGKVWPVVELQSAEESLQRLPDGPVSPSSLPLVCFSPFTIILFYSGRIT